MTQDTMTNESKANLDNFIRPLPSYLVNRYMGWRATEFEDSKSWYQHLAAEGQHPRAMLISCCDSRVNGTVLFGADSGEFFIHRNIANLIPPYNPNGDHHGTSAAIEYAVKALRVAHIIVLGHSSCGGINGGFHACNGTEKELYEDTVFIKKWLEILKPAYSALDSQGDTATKIADLEKLSITVSLKNLAGFPFVLDALEKNQISLHGLWHDIGSGELFGYDAKTESFQALS
jgi:carbonic anhydrase